jgi:hypothetical protein
MNRRTHPSERAQQALCYLTPGRSASRMRDLYLHVCLIPAHVCRNVDVATLNSQHGENFVFHFRMRSTKTVIDDRSGSEAENLKMMKSSLLHPQEQTADMAGGPRRAMSRHGVYPFLFASGFATSRAVSTKSCATGLSVRFFRVTIPFGKRAFVSSTGRTLSSSVSPSIQLVAGC